ncbi:hypothetical protein ACFW9I_02635 [[Kitasatospora] papulosa]|uniref:hypothetical protein n=1 Tax=[Kitasatospora] papulosa TaxID=1464011 RepID=UPI00367CB7A4
MTVDLDADDLPTPRLALPERIQLARQLTAGVGNWQMQRGTHLLGFCQDGYWLRRFAHDPALAEALEPADRPTSVNWDRVVELLNTPGALEDDDLEPGTMGPHLALLEIATSLAVGRPVDLCRAARILPAADWRDILARMENAALHV